MSGSNPDTYAGAPTQHRRLLLTLDTYARQELEVLLVHLLDEAEIVLVDSAFSNRSTQHRLQALEAVGALRRLKMQPPNLCRAACFVAVAAATSTSAAPDDAELQASHQLALVALDEFEVQLALRKAIRHGSERCELAQLALMRRLGHLLQRELDESVFPLAIPTLLQALCRELLAAGIDVTLLPVLLGVARRTLIDGLAQLYDELNERLKQVGVLPGFEIDQWPALQRARSQSSSPEEGAAKEGAREEQPREEALPPDAVPESVEAADPAPAVYRASQQLLQLLHEVAPGGHEAVELLGSEGVIDVLSALQSQPGRAALSRPLLARVEEYLAAQGLERALPQQSAAQIQLSEHVIEMLARLLRDLPELQQLVRRLEIPLAAASLADTTLFEHPEHPAHHLVNTMGELSAYRSQIDGALGARIADILTPVTASVPCAETQLAEANRALTALSERQRKARDKSIQRLVEACEGQQRLLQAGNAVDRELYKRLAHVDVARPLINLVENGWRELLRLTWLRDGVDSAAWSEALGMLDELLWWFSRLDKTMRQGDEAQSGDSQAWMTEVALLSERVQQRLQRSFPVDFRHGELVDAVRAVLSRERPLQLEQGPFAFQPRPARVKGLLRAELEHAYPELTPWLRRLRDYRTGETFAYTDDRSGMQHTLVWISADHQNFVFVDNAGSKSLDLDIVDFARELSRGLKPLADSDRQPLVNRAIADSAQSAFEQIIDRQSVDEITGLLNRRYFEEKVHSAVLRARSQQQRYTLLYIDVDHFAVVNQLYGHVAGDELLRRVGITLAQVAGSDAEIARLMGNEFALLIPTERSRAAQLADAMREQVRQTVYHLAAGNAEVTLSIGAVEIDKFAENAATVLRDALFACSEAKTHGRDQLQLFEGSDETILRRDRMLHWINQLGELLDEQALALRVQPIVAVGDIARVSHYEVLLGLRGENGELGSPIEFIEAAERYGSMRRVDRWVIDQALAWLGAAVRRHARPLSLAINLSANSLNDPSLADFLFERFGAHGVAPRLVCFEITETATIDNLISTADFIRRVKRLGCSFALDDFGTGRCSYEYLKQLPVDYLKIDGAFIESINDSAEDLLIVRSINEIAHAMGIRTIAEYVSSDAVLARLVEIGVDFAQGFAIGRPVAIDAIDADIARMNPSAASYQ